VITTRKSRKASYREFASTEKKVPGVKKRAKKQPKDTKMMDF